MKHVGATLILSTSLYADNYQLYFNPSSAQNIDELLIVNTSSATAIRTPLSEYHTTSQYNAFNNVQGTPVTNIQATFVGAQAVVQDIVGSSINIKDLGLIRITPANGSNYTYDRIVSLDLSSGRKISETLIASSQAEYDFATQAGFNTILINNSEAANSNANATLLTTYTANITNQTSQILTNGGFSTNQITAADGASLFRQETDGTVHVGENSIVFADESISSSGNDEIYSSSGTLQLGNNESHKTIIMGTLEVPNPTLPSHAANKGYVDNQISIAKDYAEGLGAMSMASSAIMTSSNGRDGFGVGVAGINGHNAIAVGINGTINDKTKFSVGTSYSDIVKSVGVSGGLHISW